jgi:polyisoprenoid-binding protein YceI
MKTLLLLPVLLAAWSLPVATPAAPVRADDWVVDSVHSTVMFKVKHANATWFHGSFDVVEGSVSLDAKAPESGKVEITIPVDSVHTHDAKRDAHLKGEDFFKGKENPKITFKSTKIAKKGEALEVTGDLELAGAKKPVTMTVEKTGEGEFMGSKVVGWSSTFTIKRSDFGMTYGLAKNALGDEVTLTFGLELKAKK